MRKSTLRHGTRPGLSFARCPPIAGGLALDGPRDLRHRHVEANRGKGSDKHGESKYTFPSVLLIVGGDAPTLTFFMRRVDRDLLFVMCRMDGMALDCGDNLCRVSHRASLSVRVADSVGRCCRR